LLKLKSLFDYIKGSKRVVKRQSYLLFIHRLLCVNVFYSMSRSKNNEGWDTISEFGVFEPWKLPGYRKVVFNHSTTTIKKSDHTKWLLYRREMEIDITCDNTLFVASLTQLVWSAKGLIRAWLHEPGCFGVQRTGLARFSCNREVDFYCV